MVINLSPMRRDDTLTLSKQGDVLTINGEDFDFTAIPEGATLPASAVHSDFVIGTVQRVDGTLHLTLVLPHGPHPTQDQAFPQPLVNPADGELTLPANAPEPGVINA